MTSEVIVLTTGGTIEQRSEHGVATMNFDPDRLISALGLPHIGITFEAVMRKGSMDIASDDWETIATSVANAIAKRPRGVVVLHGTDTMHYTASALSFMLRDLGVPVVMTGSMIPGGDSGSDAVPNLRDAIEVASKAEFAEVCIVFSADVERSKGLIIRGCRARKVHSYAIHAFSSINAQPIGSIAMGKITRTLLEVNPRNLSAPRLATSLDTNVVLIKLTPNISPPMLVRLLGDASGAVIEGTGIGHIKTELQPVIAQFGKPVVMSTQTLQGGERLGAYDVDRNILAIDNLIPARDMNSDTALVKLMWALRQGGNLKSIMQTSVAGEISA